MTIQVYYEVRSCYNRYLNVRWTVVTNCDSIFIANCDTVYYKLLQALQSAITTTRYIQITMIITNCDSSYS